jgi:peptidoglycan/xylan/chitin deacetylase (PgdA/CDA1 family)
MVLIRKGADRRQMTLDWPLILAYHHIDAAASSRYVVPAPRLQRGLGSMLERGFTPLSLDEALAAGPFGSGDAATGTFTITFDDGMESFAELALPVLERLDLVRAVTLFVPTAYVGGTNEWIEQPTTLQRLMPWSDVPERLLGWDEIADVAAAGVSVQSHGHRHLAMQEIAYEETLADAVASREALAAHGIHATHFALPYGWHSPECERAIADAGFADALSVKWGGRSRYEVRRIPVYGTDHAVTRRLKESGRYFQAFDTAARLAGRKRYAR